MTALPHAAPDAPDAELVARVLAGDRALFAVLVERHQRSVRRMVAGVLDGAMVENLVQQTFVSAYEHLRRYRPELDLGAWLRGIAVNLLRQELRRSGRERRHLRAYHDHLLAQMNDEADAHQRFARLDAALADCLQGLAPAAARAIELRYRDGLGIPQVAEALGRTALATRQLLHRARALLRACVEARTAEAAGGGER